MEITLLVNSKNIKKIAKINSQSDGNNIVGKQSKHKKKPKINSQSHGNKDD